MSNIIDIFGKLKSEEEKMEFLSAQLAVINRQGKEIDQLKSEKKHLEQLLKAKVPAIDGTIAKEEMGTPEELICIEQLKMLKSFSEDRELTLEETRKVEIYAKILFQGKNGNKKSNPAVDKMTTEQLLSIVENKDSGS